LEESRQKMRIPVALYFSIVSSVLLVLISIFRWYLIEIFTMSSVTFLGLLIILLFLISMSLNIIHIKRHVREENFRTFIPFLISTITILIIWFVPLTNIAVAWDFNANFKDREEVISMIKTGELASNVSYNRLITLPKEYANLSNGGGEILLEKEGDKLKVLFYTFRGILGDYSGFVYVSDDSEIQEGDFNKDFLRVEKKKEYWYWVISK